MQSFCTDAVFFDEISTSAAKAQFVANIAKIHLIIGHIIFFLMTNQCFLLISRRYSNKICIFAELNYKYNKVYGE